MIRCDTTSIETKITWSGAGNQLFHSWSNLAFHWSGMDIWFHEGFSCAPSLLRWGCCLGNQQCSTALTRKTQQRCRNVYILYTCRFQGWIGAWSQHITTQFSDGEVSHPDNPDPDPWVVSRLDSEVSWQARPAMWASTPTGGLNKVEETT